MIVLTLPQRALTNTLLILASYCVIYMLQTLCSQISSTFSARSFSPFSWDLSIPSPRCSYLTCSRYSDLMGTSKSKAGPASMIYSQKNTLSCQYMKSRAIRFARINQDNLSSHDADVTGTLRSSATLASCYLMRDQKWNLHHSKGNWLTIGKIGQSLAQVDAAPQVF
jgi:hypothetical protein